HRNRPDQCRLAHDGMANSARNSRQFGQSRRRTASNPAAISTTNAPERSKEWGSTSRWSQVCLSPRTDDQDKDQSLCRAWWFEASEPPDREPKGTDGVAIRP